MNTEKATEHQPSGAAVEGPRLSEGLGARCADFAQFLLGVTAVYVTLRTLAPADLAWWQGAAMGATAAIVSTVWTRRR